MSSNIKSKITAKVYENRNHEISGEALQETLLEMVDAVPEIAYTKAQVDGKVAQLISDIDKKADKTSVYTKAQVDSTVSDIEKETDKKLAKKLDIEQGAENEGKTLAVGDDGKLALVDGGSGAGFYNLDNEKPLADGVRYTIETAVAVVAADSKIKAKDKNGMVIQFYDGGQWRYYAYQLPYDEEDEDAVANFANIDNWKEFESGSGGGGQQVGRIILERITPNLIKKVGDRVVLQFRFDHVTGSGADQSSTGNSGTATFTISRAGYRESFRRTYTAGVQQMDVTKYCERGTNTIRLQMAVDTGEVVQTAQITWTISEIQLDLTSSNTVGDKIVSQGTMVSVNYALESGNNEVKSIVCYLDGEQYKSEVQGTSSSSGQFDIDTNYLAHGKHTIQLRAQQSTGEINEDGEEDLVYSNLIYTVFGVTVDGVSAPIATTTLNIADGSKIFALNENPTIKATQYDTLSFRYGAFPYGTVVLKSGESTLMNGKYEGVEGVFEFRVMESGTHQYSIVAGTAVLTFDIDAAKSDIGADWPSGRTLYLDAADYEHGGAQSNESDKRDTWDSTIGGVTTTSRLTDFTFYGDGWRDGALRFMGGSKAQINYSPLSRTDSGGATFGFLYKCSAVSDEDAKVISCLNAQGDGFYITPTKVVFGKALTGDNPIVWATMLTAPDTMYDVQFVIWPSGSGSSEQTRNQSMVYIVINGVISGGYKMSSGASAFLSGNTPIRVSGDGATLDLYRVWAYRRALGNADFLTCFVLDQDRDITTMLEKITNNDVLDPTTQEVSPDSLPIGTRVMIITGKAFSDNEQKTMASVLAAAHDNVKSKFFEVEEIETYLKGEEDKSKNFWARTTGEGSLMLRLQGTSSLAYPVKNYRIYTQRKGKYSEMYVGIDPEQPFGESGEMIEDCTFAMHGDSAPVSVWCLKADYAESSSAHNTGMARLVNDTLKALEIQTPAQRDADKETYPYEVRTTVDGEPMILFYRETVNDTPKFLGKYNFNNDKSTEAVYGFTEIDGYHDVTPLNDIDNEETHFTAQQYHELNPTAKKVGDLTECWEFKNNEDPMGSFLDDDFDSDKTEEKDGEIVTKRKWTGTFEARYPDNDDLNEAFEKGTIKPHYLSTLVSWVKSTKDDPQKFKDELHLYFDVEHLCSYFTFTQIMACLDQMVKNMMIGFWYDKNADSSSPMGKTRAYMIFYDNDTILGVINNGRLQAPYDVNRQTVQMVDASGADVYYYAGHESVLWNNLQSQFANEVRSAYVKVRGFLTNAKIFEYFDTKQADMFCERIFNLDAVNKYVSPDSMSEEDVAPYRDLMQGNRKSHRHYFVENRMSLLDNQWRTGEFDTAQNEIRYKGISAEDSSIRFTLKRDGNVEVRSDVSDEFVKNYSVEGGVETTITKATASAVGTIFHVYGVRQMTKLDISEWDIDQLNMGSMPQLEEFVFNDYEDEATEE